MRILYQKPLSSFCRKVRLVLDEKNLEYNTINKDMKEDAVEILRLNPSGHLPILIDDKGVVIVYHQAICEYLEEVHKIGLLGESPEAKAEVRRLCHWFDEKFQSEITRYLLSEKVYKRLESHANPNGRTIAAARTNIANHMQYLAFLLDQYDFLAGNFLSLADLTAAAHLSVVDYLGEVPWGNYKDVKDWYMKIKSRPSFKSIRQERMKGIFTAAPLFKS